MPDLSSNPEPRQILSLRILLAISGTAAGFSFWVLFSFLPDLIDQTRLLILLAAFAGGFFAGLLLMLGRIDLRRALVFACALGALPAGLLFWAGFRFATADGFLNSGHPIAAYLVLVSIPLPFLLTYLTSDRGWRDYEGLFDHAWSIFVRGATAWAFVGLFWLVIFLGDALLSLVNFTYLDLLFREDWIAMPLTGCMLGLALAVLNELAQVVSTLRRLALQLLRLLLPLVGVMVALFIVLVPFQGLDKVFGQLSAAATMLAMAAGAVTLITAAIDARNEDSVQSRLMVVSAKALSVLLPLIAGIAVYAIWLRVEQYGWTPARLSGAVLSLVVLVYALGYAISVLAGAGWRNHIRQANTWLAVAIVGLSLLWLTPVLNAERISANDQFKRFVAGITTVENLDLWPMAHDWGLAGQVAVEQLRRLKDHPQQVALTDKLARLDTSDSRYGFANEIGPTTTANELESLTALLPVLPEGHDLPEGLLQSLSARDIRQILEACRDELPDGRPGCALVLGQFDPSGERLGGVILWRAPVLNAATIEQDPFGSFVFNRQVLVAEGDLTAMDADQTLADILDGKAAFAPTRLNTFVINGTHLLPSSR